MELYNELRTISMKLSEFAHYVPNSEYEKVMTDVLEGLMNETETLLAFSPSQCWVVGQAFQGIIEQHRSLDDSEQKLCVACCIFCYIKALEMGTIQSVMALKKLFQFIQDYRNITDLYFAAMSDARMKEDFNIPQELLRGSDLPYKEALDYRLASVLAILIAVLENKNYESMKTQEKRGKYYLSALMSEAISRIKGYGSFGMVI